VQWLNEPARWSAQGSELAVTADAATDFWRVTGYGYIRDSGHLYGEVMGGDFDLSVLVRGCYADQYDQAGAMVRVDERRWLKTGTVVTLDHSSWALADLPQAARELSLLLSRRGDSVEVRYRVDGGELQLAAVAYLPPDDQVLAGAMCAAPQGRGFRVTFHDLAITAR
jgi:regulation of enolase protein 1 (concanavalin A-like superfamily)